MVDNIENGGSGVKFRIDTGADETVIPEQLYNELIGVNPLRKANKKLFGVGNNGLLAVVGMFTTVLQGKTTATKQNVYVVRGIHKALLGKIAIDALRLISRVESVEGATDEYHRISGSLQRPRQDGRAVHDHTEGERAAFRRQCTETCGPTIDGENEKRTEEDGSFGRHQ